MYSSEEAVAISMFHHRFFLDSSKQGAHLALPAILLGVSLHHHLVECVPCHHHLQPGSH